MFDLNLGSLFAVVVGILLTVVGILTRRVKREVRKTRKAMEERAIALAQAKHNQRMADAQEDANEETEARIAQVEKEIKDGQRDHFEKDR